MTSVIVIIFIIVVFVCAVSNRLIWSEGGEACFKYALPRQDNSTTLFLLLLLLLLLLLSLFVVYLPGRRGPEAAGRTWSRPSA